MAQAKAANLPNEAATMPSVNHMPRQSASVARWDRFDQTLIAARSRFSDLSAVELQAVIDDAVTASCRG